MSDQRSREIRRPSSRSRSPDRHHHVSYRERSSHRHRHRHHSHHHHKTAREPRPPPPELPYSSRLLTKHDYEVFKPMFALYLDIQKNKDLYSLDETEARGRWKSFIGKWNRGELSEGWYDPTTFQKAVAAGGGQAEEPRDERPPAGESDREISRGREARRGADREESYSGSESDGSVGPALPGQEPRGRGRRPGPSIPNVQELELRRENESEEAYLRRKTEREDLQYARRLERRSQKEKLEELVPRAAAGTRERQLEKKREVNEKMKSFRERSPGAAEVPEAELMGGGDGIAEFRRRKEEGERRKNEREIRREEMLRARAQEREERLGEYREKEERTMEMLKGLARARFGGA